MNNALIIIYLKKKLIIMINYTTNFLFICSISHSPLISPAKSSASYSFENCKFHQFYNSFYRSSLSLVKERLELKKTKFSSFVATPLDISPEYKSETFFSRLEVVATDEISSLTIIDCQFMNITSNDRGGSIRIAKHIPLILNNSLFLNVVSRYEAAILFVLLEDRVWSLKPVNINDCFFDSCYSTGEYFQILDNYSDKYPSVLIHEFLGFLYTSIESRTFSVSAVNCQENKDPKKKFGAILHFHTNTFQLNYFNCSNRNKIDSSQVFFTQSHKQASNANYIYAIGQAGYSFIEIKDIQSTDQLTIQYLNIINSTLFTEELSTSGNKTDFVKSNFGIIDFGGYYSGSVVFIYCNFNNIITDNILTNPILSFSSNGLLPIFANCFSNIDSIASNQGFTFGTPLKPTTYLSSTILLTTTVKTPSITPSQSPLQTILVTNVKKNKIKNFIVIVVSIVATVILTVIFLVVVHRIYYNKIIFIDEADDSVDQQEVLINTSITIENTEDPYIE